MDKSMDKSKNKLAKSLNLKTIKLLNGNYAVIKNGVKLSEHETREQAYTWCNNYIPGQTTII